MPKVSVRLGAAGGLDILVLIGFRDALRRKLPPRPPRRFQQADVAALRASAQGSGNTSQTSTDDYYIVSHVRHILSPVPAGITWMRLPANVAVRLMHAKTHARCDERLTSLAEAIARPIVKFVLPSRDGDLWHQSCLLELADQSRAAGEFPEVARELRVELRATAFLSSAEAL